MLEGGTREGGGIFSINTKGSVPRSCSLGYRATLPPRDISFRGGGGGALCAAT